MELTGGDYRRLVEMERWCSYDEKFPLSMLEVIQNDLRNGGRNFSRFVNEETAIVDSFTIGDIPEADILLVLGKSPRDLEYVAEIAVKYRNKYGYYPEFIAITFPHSFGLYEGVKAEWFEQAMISLGFPKDWALKNHSDFQVVAEYEAIVEISRMVRSIPCKGKKPRVLAVTSAGLSLKEAQRLPIILPHIEFSFFEVPQLDFSARLFDNEVFSPETYAVDQLVASVIDAQLRREGEKIPLSIEKRFTRPEVSYLKDLVLRGYCGFLRSEMWKFLGLNHLRGMKQSAKRRAELASYTDVYKFDEQCKTLIKRVSRKFRKNGWL